MPATRVTIHRLVSWWLVVFALLTMVTGYSVSRRWVIDRALFTNIHLILEWTFLFLLGFHIIYTLVFVKIKTKTLLGNARRHWIRIIQHGTKWFIVVFALLTAFSGLTWYNIIFDIWGQWVPFAWHISFDLLLAITIILHSMAGAKTMLLRRGDKRKLPTLLILLIGGILLIAGIYLDLP